jgi:hypothetical protein
LVAKEFVLDFKFQVEECNLYTTEDLRDVLLVVYILNMMVQNVPVAATPSDQRKETTIVK